MKALYNCFIQRNNKKLRSRLNKLGYMCYGKDASTTKHTCIYVHNSGIYYLTDKMPSRSFSIINCEKDEEKFIKIISDIVEH